MPHDVACMHSVWARSWANTCSCSPLPLPVTNCVARPTAARHSGEPPVAATHGQDAGRGRSSSLPHKVPRLATAAPAGSLHPQLEPSTSSGQAIPATAPTVVELNVGGMLFSTSCATLEESQSRSMLAALISGRHGPPRCDAQVRRGEGGTEGRILVNDGGPAMAVA